MALPDDHRRAPAGTRAARRPEDAPALAAVPSPPAAAADNDPPDALPGVLAQALHDAPGTGSGTATAVTERTTEQARATAAPSTEPVAADAEADEHGAVELAETAGSTEADVQRGIRWLGVTYRPPDVWRERQPSLAEEWAFALDGSHLPEAGPWRAAARAYAAPALGLISLLHGLIWILRSPARHATAWVVAAVVVVTALYMT